jgi:hypothetical protein
MPAIEFRRKRMSPNHRAHGALTKSIVAAVADVSRPGRYNAAP